MKNLTTKATETAQDVSTTLTSMQETQLIRTVTAPSKHYDRKTCTGNGREKEGRRCKILPHLHTDWM